MLTIKNFIDCPEALPFIARLIHQEWFAHKPGHTVEGLLTQMRGGKRAEIPIGLAAFVDGIPAGTVSLLETDLKERRDLRPWVAGLLVFPDFRTQGVGTALMHSLMEIAARIECSPLYLYTKIPEFYKKLGWKQIAPVISDPQCCVMTWNAQALFNTQSALQRSDE